MESLTASRAPKNTAQWRLWNRAQRRFASMTSFTPSGALSSRNWDPFQLGRDAPTNPPKTSQWPLRPNTRKPPLPRALHEWPQKPQTQNPPDEKQKKNNRSTLSRARNVTRVTGERGMAGGPPRPGSTAMGVLANQRILLLLASLPRRRGGLHRARNDPPPSHPSSLRPRKNANDISC